MRSRVGSSLGACGTGLGDIIPRSWRILHFLKVEFWALCYMNYFVAWNKPVTKSGIKNIPSWDNFTKSNDREPMTSAGDIPGIPGSNSSPAPNSKRHYTSFVLAVWPITPEQTNTHIHTWRDGNFFPWSRAENVDLERLNEASNGPDS